MCLKVVLFLFYDPFTVIIIDHITYSFLTNHVRDGHVYPIFNAIFMFIAIFIVLHSSAIFSSENTTNCEKNKHGDKHCHCIRATIDMTIFNVIRYKMRYFISL